MIFRGTVQNGVVVLPAHADLPNGTPVEVTPRVTQRPRKTRSKAQPKKAGKPGPGFGAWAHRKDIKDSAAYALELRKNLLGRRDNRG